MENNKIDRLFQDKLSRHEIDPSAGAWEAVHAQLIPQRKPVMWYAIAAAVAVLAVVAVLLIRTDDTVPTSQMAKREVDHPTPPVTIQFTIPRQDHVAEVKQPVEERSTSMKPRRKHVLEQLAHVPQMTEELEVVESSEVMDLPTETAVAQVDRQEPNESVEAIEAPPGVSVQITYKATAPVAAPEKSKIEKLWAKARDIKPGEMLGSIRETKNDFFNGKKN